MKIVQLLQHLCEKERHEGTKHTNVQVSIDIERAQNEDNADKHSVHTTEVDDGEKLL